MKILILEDDPSTGEFLLKCFLNSGFESQLFDNGKLILKYALSNNFDLMVADIMVPGLSGLRVLEELRRNKKQQPIIFLSSKQSVEERVKGLQIGGDDYLTKPFSYTELLARCQAILRRYARATEPPTLRVKDLELNIIHRQFHRENEVIKLQQKESILLEYMIRNKGTILTKNQILEKVWHPNFTSQTNVVDVLVSRLRAKIENKNSHRLIHTVRGIGYIFNYE